MKKKMTNIIEFDSSKLYKLPMLPETNSFFNFKEDIVEANIEQKSNGSIRVYKEGYKDKHFWDSYFQYLLDTKYIEIIK